MRIAVLVKQVPDTWDPPRLDAVTGRLDRASNPVADEISERAVEAALDLRDATGGEVVAVTMGPAGAVAVLRKALAMGADSAVHILDDALAGADLRATAAALAAAVEQRGFDLVLTGVESSDGRGGIVPAMLAEHLGLPLLAALDRFGIVDGDVVGERRRAGREEAAKAHIPAVVSITESLPDPRFPGIKGSVMAKRKPIETVTAATLGLELEDLPRSVVVSARERAPRAAGIRIADTPDVGLRLASLLRERGLVGETTS